MLLLRLQVDAPESAADLVEQDDIRLRLVDRLGIERNQIARDPDRFQGGWSGSRRAAYRVMSCCLIS
jgi:hypothetical protein